MKYFIIIDMQKDFVNGVLANPAAKAIIPGIIKKAKELKEQGYTIIATRDTHNEKYMETQEGKNLPIPHCIVGTPGWEIVDKIKPFVDLYVDKKSFGYADWVDEDPYSSHNFTFLAGLENAERANEDFAIEGNNIEPTEIAMCGTCTAICVASNFSILKAAYPEVPITVYKDLCACLTPETHEAAITVMKTQQAIIK